MWNYILYRFGQFIALNLPIKLAYAIGVFLSDIRYLYAAQDKREVYKNLQAIFPEKSNRQIKEIRRRMFRNFSKYLVDFFRFSKYNREYIRRNITIENVHYLDEVLSQKKGAVVLTAHIGNWELGGIVIAELGYPFWAVALPHKHKKVNSFFNAQRQQHGVKIIPANLAVRQCFSVLKNNGFIALLGDRDFSKEGGVVVNFFGRETFLPKGPAAFSIKTASPIVAGFMLRNPDDTFTLRFEKPIQFKIPEGPNSEAREKQFVKELTIQYKMIIEDYIRKYPDQWYMFRQFWIS